MREEFKDPPNEYRPISIKIEYGPSGNTVQKLEDLFTVQSFGGIVFEPTSGTKKNYGIAKNSPSLRHSLGGLMGKHVAGQSPWVMISPPGTVPSGVTPQDFLTLIANTSGIDSSISSGSLAKPSEITTGEPGYLSKEWFDYIKEILAYLRETGHKAVFYDEVGFPSGMANHTTPKELYRKILEKSEETITGPLEYQTAIPEEGKLMAVVAIDINHLKRLDLTSLAKEGQLKWQAPAGEWKIMVFKCRTLEAVSESVDYYAVTDYLDPVASKWFINKVYEPLYKEVGEYFGNTIFQTFYDDVGVFNEEKTWTFKFNDKFKELTGKDPNIYYPALWYNIGPETEAARVAFFDTRAELLADGFPKVLTNWGKERNLPISGHAPGNYEIQPVDMCGDPFKFYRAQPIPMVDVIFNYPFGRDGFKLVSDGGDLYDKPIVSAEIFPPFVPGGTTMGYRRAMELYIRGINRFCGAGLSKSMGLGNSQVSEEFIGESSDFAEWCGRISFLMQGGRRVSEIAIFYPIAALEAFYYFDAPEYVTEMRWGSFVPHESDYLAIGEMLLNQVHCDFTFIHPEVLLSDKIKVNGSSLDLDNKVNHQHYKVLILPGQKVISMEALQKIKAYYEAGGSVIATSLLPSKAAELPTNAEEAVVNDRKVQEIIKTMFGIDSGKPMPEGVSEIKINDNKGKAIFISQPNPDLLAQILEKLEICSDIMFSGNPAPSSGGGALSYVHKIKNDLNIYFIANSTDEKVNTYVEVRGEIKPEIWNPYNGEITKIDDFKYIKKQDQDYTRFPLNLDPVKAILVVSN